MSVHEHVHDLPTEDELAQLVGAATPHFAFQAAERIAQLAAALPPDHPRQPELRAHLEYLERLGYEGETAGVERPDLPPRPSLEIGARERPQLNALEAPAAGPPPARSAPPG